MQILIKKPEPDGLAVKQGDVLSVDGTPCILAVVGMETFDLINLVTGNRVFGAQHSVEKVLKMARVKYHVCLLYTSDAADE